MQLKAVGRNYNTGNHASGLSIRQCKLHTEDILNTYGQQIKKGMLRYRQFTYAQATGENSAFKNKVSCDTFVPHDPLSQAW